MKFLKKFFSIIIVSLLIFPFNFSKASAVSALTITVNVVTSTDVGIQSINITLVGPSSFSSTKATNTDGETEFEALEDEGEYTATISLPSSSVWELKTGESSSKSVDISAATPTKTIKFTVQKKTDTTGEEPSSDTAEILKVKLPAEFTKTGSTTTDLSKLDKTKLDQVSNFTLDDPKFNKIVFLDKIDLSDDKYASKFEELDKYVRISDIGRVSIDTDALPILNKRAQITMRGLNLAGGAEPKVLEDGRKTSNVSKVKYSNGELTFEASSFSAYMFAPTLEIYNEEKQTDKADLVLKGHVDDLDSKVDIYLGEEKVGDAIKPDRSGDFQLKYTLKEKTNNFKIVAFSENGQVDEQNFSIEYSGGTVEEPKQSESQQIPFLLVLAGVAGVAIIVWLIIYFLRKAKKNKQNPVIETELKDLEQTNPAMPETEKEDLEEAKMGPTDLTEMTKDNK